MELFDTVYQGKLIPFDFYKENVMVNATEMAKIFGKTIGHFMENKSTKNFIDECLNSRNSDYLNVGTKEDLIKSSPKTGTWMHRVLALKFAAWLDPGFELWVYCTIDKILFDHFRRVEKSLKDSARRKNEISNIKQQLRSDEMYLKLEQLELEERQASYKRGKSHKSQISAYQYSIIEEE